MNDESNFPEDLAETVKVLPHVIFGNTLALVSFIDFLTEYVPLPRDAVLKKLSSDSEVFLRQGFGEHAAFQVLQVADLLQDKPAMDTSGKAVSDILKRMMK